MVTVIKKKEIQKFKIMKIKKKKITKSDIITCSTIITYYCVIKWVSFKITK